MLIKAEKSYNLCMRKIPRTMSTQHPDNVSLPFFADSQPIGGEDEITEAYYAFSHLGCEEQMWDFEGKEVDEFVVRKLLSRYPHFFKENPLGEKCFLTLRVPNPSVEKTEGKILLEVLESIPRSYDLARLLNPRARPPIFEVILPMTRSSQEIERIAYYYRKFVGNKGDFVFPDGTRLSQWIGDFSPQEIEIIPLFEDIESLLKSSFILKEYFQNKDLPYQRVFLARSDPALNYGSLAAILSLKVALFRLEKLEESWGRPIYPIVGVGSCPFRGNFKPTNIENCLKGYPSVQTFTIQSAFKYDYPTETVIQAIKKLNRSKRKKAIPLKDEKKVIELARKSAAIYQSELEVVAPLVNEVSPFIPPRRLRKLHIGLFGYSRQAGKKISLPRAISFCAALYSIGFPPEVLGLGALGKEEIKLIQEIYPDFHEDLADALTYFNPRSLNLFPKLKSEVKKVLKLTDFKTERLHLHLTSKIMEKLEKKEDIKELIIEAAWARKFLG